MSAQQLTNLRKLSLSVMSQALEQQLEQPGNHREFGFTERLELLVDHELQRHHQRRIEQCLKSADFRLAATLDEIDWYTSRNLHRQQIAQLSQ